MIYSVGHKSQSMTLIIMQNKNCVHLLMLILRFVEKLQASRDEMMTKQHNKVTSVNIKEGDNVMVHLPERNNKLSPRFMGPHYVLRCWHGNKQA